MNRFSGWAAGAQQQVGEIAVGLGELDAHGQVAQSRGHPEFGLLVVVLAGQAQQLEGCLLYTSDAADE